MVQELAPDVRSGLPIHMEEIRRHIDGCDWATDLGSIEILLLLMMANGNAKIIGTRKSWEKQKNGLPYVRISL